jgi:hypothetical protein
LQILENSGRYWETSIYQYLYQYCRYWKILVRTVYRETGRKEKGEKKRRKGER